MPKELKDALILPLLKKITLELICMSYRPVSNLPYLGKLTEKAAAIQLLDQVSRSGVAELFQSSYKEYHSTETALLRVNNDILRSMDQNQCVLLILLDLSAAFDTIDHEILITRLHDYCGVTDAALQWFKDYLNDRDQYIVINSGKGEAERSSPAKLKYGVPQGSVLGPILYTIYMLPLGDLIRQHGIQFHFYADDSELYLAFKPIQASATIAIDRMVKCASDIKIWMCQNKLKLNDGKTEFMVISKGQLPETLTIPDLRIGDSVIVPSDSVRNLGSYWDNRMKMDVHIANVCKSSYLQLHNMYCIKNCLNAESLATLAHAFVTSRLDYANGLLYGIPEYQLRRLQGVQNNCARLVDGARKYDHVTPILFKLHWLPVRYRIQYKIILTVFKALNGMAPGYLEELLRVYDPDRVLKSVGTKKLVQPKSKTKTWGDRAFSVAGPKLWNSLPVKMRTMDDLDEFKKCLKTHFFNIAFYQS